MTTRQITTITSRCAAAVLAGCLLASSPIRGRVGTYYPSSPV